MAFRATNAVARVGFVAGSSVGFGALDSAVVSLGDALKTDPFTALKVSQPTIDSSRHRAIEASDRSRRPHRVSSGPCAESCEAHIEEDSLL